MTDIVERLRQAPVDNRPATLLNEAADEIERLRVNMQWLRAVFRVNMLRAYPDIKHEEIDEKIKFVEEYHNRTALENNDENRS